MSLPAGRHALSRVTPRRRSGIARAWTGPPRIATDLFRFKQDDQFQPVSTSRVGGALATMATLGVRSRSLGRSLAERQPPRRRLVSGRSARWAGGRADRRPTRLGISQAPKR